MLVTTQTLWTHRWLYILAAGIGLVLAVGPVSAEEQAASVETAEDVSATDDEATKGDQHRGIEEIVVTAEKREGKLQETPIAVTAFTNEGMKKQVINNANDYTLIVPSFSYREYPNRAFIRGIGRNENALGLDPGVAIYNDGVYTSETSPLFSSSFGVERIEILRGPQGTLYGRSATGGAVNIISEKPSPEFHAKARIITGNFGSQQEGLIVTGPIGGPVGNRLRYHFLFNHAKQNGTIHNLGGEDLGSLDDYFYRAQLEADVTDDLNLWIQYDYLTWDRKGENYGTVLGVLQDPYATTTPFTSPLTLNPQFGWTKPNPSVNDLHTVDNNDVSHVRLDPSWSLRGQAKWEGPVILKWIAGYTSYDWKSVGGDLDKTSNPSQRVLEDVAERKTYASSEFQILSSEDSTPQLLGGDVEWLLGFYYYHEKIHQPYEIYLPLNARLETIVAATPPFLPISPPIPNSKRRVYLQTGDLETDSYAGFGEATWKFLESWSLTGGLRYSYDKKAGEETQHVYADAMRYGFPDLGTCCALYLSNPANRRSYASNWSSVSGRAVLQYQFSQDAMIYGSFTSGYKPGGFRLGGLQDDPIFDNEQLFAYELGTKTTWLDNHLQLNGTFFYYDYRDLQVVRAFTDPVSGIVNSQVINADEASVFGIEIEGLYVYEFDLLWESDVTLGVGYSFLHSRYDKFCCSEDQSNTSKIQVDLTGNPLTQSPDHKITLSANYGIDTRVGEFDLTGRFSWVDEQLYSIFDTRSPNRWGDAYHRTDILLNWSVDIPALKDISIVAFIKNVEDGANVNHVQISSAEDLARRYVNPNLPRTYGLEIHLSY